MTDQLPEFESFASITRLTRPVIVTEKIDGCNVQVYITDDGKIHAGSRNRWLSVGKTTDQFGFAGWVGEHEQELIAGLGPGRHYGEWWGAGIQRKYGLKEKRFSLFNVSRWEDGAKDGSGNLLSPRPACCNVVPVLYRGPFDTYQIEEALRLLALGGSRAAPGFMDPEGVVVFHVPSGTLFKKTLGGDGHKGEGK